MEELALEGIVLRSTPFKEKQCIIAVFTKEWGLLSLLGSVSAITGVLARSSFVVKGKNKEGLLRIQEAQILDGFSKIRQDLSSLEAAGKMAKLVLDMHQSFGQVSSIYLLLQKYFEKLGEIAATTLWASFVLKLLHHEGMLNIQTKCICEENACSLVEGESRCIGHNESFGIVFSPEEWNNLLILSHARMFEELKKVHLAKSVCEKIELLLSQFL